MQSLNRFIAFAILALSLTSCSGGGSDGGGTTTAPAGSVTITGTVSGTVIKVLRADDDHLLVSDDTAGRARDAFGHFPFQLSGLPEDVKIKVFLITGGRVYPVYLGGSNVFAVNSGGLYDLGFVTTSTNPDRADPATPPPSSSYTTDSENTALPVSIAPGISINNPQNGASLPNGPVSIVFSFQNFSIGGRGELHLHFYVDEDPTVYEFFQREVLYEGSNPVAEWQNSASIQLPALSTGSHQIRFVLTDSSDLELTNSQAQVVLFFGVGGPPVMPSIVITGPASGTQLPPGPVLVTFNIQNSLISNSTQPRMHFFVDNDPTVHKFYDGPGITEDGSTSGVRYQNAHTHFVHWKSDNSILFNALAAGSHQIRFVLVDQLGTELISTAQTLAFTVVPGTGGVFSLQEVIGNLDFPVPMATAPDGRIFVGELSTGNIRVVMPTPSLPWRLQSMPFATVPAGNAEGLLGLAVDPNFSTNGFVYAFHPASASVNRVVRFKAMVTNGNTVAESPTPSIILDDIPASSIHNGGVLQFGPDGKLYVFIGDAENPANSRSLTSLSGKILRINPDGSMPGDNPFISNANANAKKVFSLGHRNSLGFAFHPHTNDLWQTENGPDNNDEINRIVASGNYGWPTVRGISGNPSFRDPILALTPSIAPTGITAIREDSFYPAQYHNNLLFADFNNGFLHRIVLGGAGLRELVTHTIACDCGQGPLFSIMSGLNVPGQDGFIYVTTMTGISRVVLSGP